MLGLCTEISRQKPALGARSSKGSQVSVSQTDRGRENIGESAHSIKV